MLTKEQTQRAEECVHVVYQLADSKTTLINTVNELATRGFTAEEIRLALDMFHWGQHVIQ